MFRCKGIAILVAGLLAAGGRATAAPNPSPAALAALESLPASRLGVDRAGNLWAWDRRSGNVMLIDPAGERLATWSAGGMRALDVDSRWGVVGIEDQQLRWLRGSGGEVSIPLSGPVADVCWIGEHRVALSPQRAPHRVEVWDLEARAVVRTLGKAEPLPEGPGAIRMPAVLLRFDFVRELLFTFDSFTGDLQVIRANGEPAWQATVEIPRDSGNEQWLRDLDRQAKESGESQTPTLFRRFPALAQDGALWVVKDRDAAAQTVSLLRVSSSGQEVRSLTGERCDSLKFAFWGDQIVFYRDPATGRGLCNSARRFPRSQDSWWLSRWCCSRLSRWSFR